MIGRGGFPLKTSGTIARSLPEAYASTTWTAGQAYTLTFAYGNNPYRNGAYTPSALVTLTGTGTLANDTISHGDSQSFNMDWTFGTLSFVANSSSTTLTIASLDPLNADGMGTAANGGIALDAISVTAAVPEPSSLVLAGLGLAGLAAWHRKKKAVTA